jgi:hypothetical protein
MPIELIGIILVHADLEVPESVQRRLPAKAEKGRCWISMTIGGGGHLEMTNMPCRHLVPRDYPYLLVWEGKGGS